MNQNIKSEITSDHRFLDEAGDTTFFGRGRRCILNTVGVSKIFIIGMVKIKDDPNMIRSGIVELQNRIEQDSYFKRVPSIQKKIKSGGFYFHAKDDVPEARKLFYELIKGMNVSFEAIAARKVPEIFEKKHHGKETEFYADILSHLLKNKFNIGVKLVLNIAQKGSSTRHTNLNLALEKAVKRFSKRFPAKTIKTNIVFNIQNQRKEPLLNIADYCCWAVQRVFERGEIRYYEFLLEKMSLIVDLYDSEHYQMSGNYYTKKRPLTTQNKISPSTH